jgi:hypothetical protein
MDLMELQFQKDKINLGDHIKGSIYKSKCVHFPQRETLSVKFEIYVG